VPKQKSTESVQERLRRGGSGPLPLLHKAKRGGGGEKCPFAMQLADYLDLDLLSFVRLHWPSIIKIFDRAFI